MRQSLIFIAIVLLSACAKTSDTKEDDALGNRTQQDRPNIIWIVAEDISPMIPSFGDSTIQTPNLNRLAAEGIRYPNTFSIAGVCAPSRAAIATGMYPISIGAHHMRTSGNKARLDQLGIPSYGAVLPPEVEMLSQQLRKAGYYCTNNAKNDYQFKAPGTAWDENNPWGHYKSEKRFGNQRGDRPFFSVYNLEITHESQLWQENAKNHRWRDGFWIRPPKGQARRKGLIPDSLRRPIDNTLDLQLPPYLVDDKPTRKDLARVYSNIEFMDYQVGVLLNQLEKDSLLDNTIVVWYSDHGGPLPRQKRLLYDSGLRVPMIVRWPDVYRAGQVDSSLISFVDFAPTTLQMAGITPPSYIQGKTTYNKSDNTSREYIFAASDRLDEHYDRIRAIRDKRFKLLKNYYPDRPYYLAVGYREQMAAMQSLLKGRDAGTLTLAQKQWFRTTKDEIELFDTQLDPHELNNLADDPAYAKTRDRLLAVLENHLAKVGDLGDLPEQQMIQNWWGGQLDSMPKTEAVTFSGKRENMQLSSPTPGANIEYCWSPHKDCDEWFPYFGTVRGPNQKKGYAVVLGAGEGEFLNARAQRIGYQISATTSWTE